MPSEFFIPDPEGRIPSAEGYFGAFGGKFIPEALVAAVDEVAVEYEKAKGDPEFARELDDLLVHYTGQAQLPHRGAAVRRTRRWRPGVPQARGPQPHRLAQDQQRARPGAAHQAHGQDARHRGDRRRSARRRDRHRLRAVRARVHHLHGRDRHQAPGPQRGPDAHARRRGHRCEVRQPHAEGRDQRGVPRLGRQRRPHPLPVRDRGRTAPLPGHGARLPPGDRRRGPPPDPGARPAVSPTPPSPVSAAAPTPSACSTPSSRTRTYASSAASPPGTAWRPASTRRP